MFLCLCVQDCALTTDMLCLRRRDRGLVANDPTNLITYRIRNPGGQRTCLLLKIDCMKYDIVREWFAELGLLRIDWNLPRQLPSWIDIFIFKHELTATSFCLSVQLSYSRHVGGISLWRIQGSRWSLRNVLIIFRKSHFSVKNTNSSLCASAIIMTMGLIHSLPFSNFLDPLLV